MKLKPMSLLSGALALLLFGYPLAAIVRETRLDSIDFDGLGKVAAFTLIQASLSLVGAFLLGLPVGLWIGRALTPGARATLLSLYSMPTLIVATAVLALFQSAPWRFSLISVVVAHALLNAPFVALQVAEGFRDLPRQYLDVARSLGADSRALLRDFFLPFLRVQLLSAALQIFSLCWMSFTLVLLLGGGPPVSTLETEIYASFHGGELALQTGATFAMAQAVLGILPALLWAHTEKRRFPWANALERRTANEKTDVRAYAAGLLALPYLLLVKNAVAIPGEAWRAVLASGEFYRAFAWSFYLGVVTAGFTLGFAALFVLGARRSPFVRVLANIPSGISTLVLCAGFFFAYDRVLDLFSGNLAVLALLQSVGLVPMAFRWLYPRIALEDHARIAAARTLGASKIRAFFAVEFWKWRQTLLRIFALALVWSIGEYAVVAFFSGRGDREFVPQYLGRLFARYAFDEAQVVAFLLLIFTWLTLRWMMGRQGDADVA